MSSNVLAANIHSTWEQEFPGYNTQNMKQFAQIIAQPDIEFRQFKLLLKTFLYSETVAH